MSQLYVRTTYAGQFALNVLNFQSPLFGTMMSAQTKRMAVYFPIKAQQPEIEFEVIFASVGDYQAFQDFVRTTQLNALSNDTEPGVTLWWPQRNILNWSGTIRQFAGGGQRFVYAPRARFVVDLVDSLTSQRTTVSSTAPIFDTVFGLGSPEGEMQLPNTSGDTGGAPGLVTPPPSPALPGLGQSAGIPV
jgi:hypothetical protein